MSIKIYNSKKYPKYAKEKEIYDEINNIKNYKKYIVKMLYSGKIKINNTNTNSINLKYDNNNNFITVSKDYFANIKKLCDSVPCELDYFVTEINSDYSVLNDIMYICSDNNSYATINLCIFLDKLYFDKKYSSYEQ